MAIYYPSGCDPVIPAHFCDECGQLELGRVRSVGLIRDDFTFTDPSDPTEWQTGITAGKIIVIPETNGSYDGGVPKEGQSFGDQIFRNTSYTHTAQFRDPNWKENYNFWNSIVYSRSYSLAMRTETQIVLSGVTVNFEVKQEIPEDITTEIVWAITSKWQNQALAKAYDTPPGIFDRCFAVTP